MNVLFDHEQLLELLTNLYILTGVRANILDLSGRDICLSGEHAPFCTLINSTEVGHEKCQACDKQAIQEPLASGTCRLYRCHACVCEAVLPLDTGSPGIPLAYLMFGQFLEDRPMEEQWEETRAALDWYPGDLDELRSAFFQFKQFTSREVDAYVGILKALVAHIQLKDMILSTERTDLQNLEIFLDQHYMEPLSLDSISRQLNIGRTKLCNLAKELSGGKTLSAMIAQRRIRAAKKLLLQSDLSIAAVAEAVGISDYNYFTKVFRTGTGVTPSHYRKQARQRAQPG